jgi:hypothetical protein
MKDGRLPQSSCPPSLVVLRGIAILSLVFEVWMAVIILPRATAGYVDFSMFYSAGAMVRTHPGGIYDDTGDSSYTHPAYEAILFAPLSFLSYRAAYFTFALANLVMLLLVWRSLKLPWDLVAFAPLSITLLFGQDAIVFLAILCAAWVAARKGRSDLCGVMLGLDMFRFQNVLPIALFLLFWGEWKVIRGFAASSATVGVISGLLASPARYFSVLLALSHHPQTYVPRMVNLRSLIYALAPNDLRWLLPLSSIIVFILCVWTGKHRVLSDRLALAITASALISYYFFAHDWIIMLIPIAAAIEASEHRGHWLAAFMIAASLLAVFNSYFYLISIATGVIGASLWWSFGQARSLSFRDDSAS